MTSPYAPGSLVETPLLHLARIPDDADSWGDEYRATLDVLDAHPGVAPVTALPTDPWIGQVVYYQGGWQGWTGMAWRPLVLGTGTDVDRLYDWQTLDGEQVVRYIGVAPVGSADTAAIWRIQRFNYVSGTDGAILMSSMVATGAWTSRVSLLG